jgi:hypothetical protein
MEGGYNMKSKKCDSQVVAPVTWTKLRTLIKIHGLQTSIFDPRLVELDWDGLVYKIRIADDILYLVTIEVHMDIIVGRLKQFEQNIFDHWMGRRVW